MIEQTVYKLLRHGPSGVQTPTRIIVHAMAEYIVYNGQVLHAVDFLAAVGLSAHALATPSGVIIRGRKDDQGAWHAKHHNTNSLGIEFLAPGVHNYSSFAETIDGKEYVSDAAYLAGVKQCREWTSAYNIKSVDRHSDVDPSRKIDPGDMFPWEPFKEAVLEE